MRKFIIILFIILLVVAILLVVKKSKTEVLNNTDISGIEQSQLQDNSFLSTSSGGQSMNNSKSVDITVEGGNFLFTPNIIKVKQGDTVNITFVNKEGFHDLKIDEFNIATSQIKAGEKEKITFVADKKGSFEYYCTVGTHRQMGMKGTLIVE